MVVCLFLGFKLLPALRWFCHFIKRVVQFTDCLRRIICLEWYAMPAKVFLLLADKLNN